jgi:eukaryotic-like serine/threonine-protein kinase
MTPGQRLGPYVLEVEVGRGAMGVVYQALDTRSGQPVALKVLLAADVPSARERFRREAEALTRLSHPHILRILDAGVLDGKALLVTELVAGESLQRTIEQGGPFEPRRAARVCLSLAQALEHAHGHGTLHRDLKPENVLLDPRGEPRLTDFGLVRLTDLSTQGTLSASGQFMGTPGYWPPEQALGQRDRIDVRSDVYGLGAILYALLCGQPPQRGKTLMDYLDHVDEPPTPPRQHRPEIPRDLEAVCLRCLQPDPDDRYPDMGEVAHALQQTLRAPSRSSSRGALLASAGAAAVVGGLGLAAWLALSTGPAPAAPPPDLAEVAPESAPPTDETAQRTGEPTPLRAEDNPHLMEARRLFEDGQSLRAL